MRSDDDDAKESKSAHTVDVRQKPKGIKLRGRGRPRKEAKERVEERPPVSPPHVQVSEGQWGGVDPLTPSSSEPMNRNDSFRALPSLGVTSSRGGGYAVSPPSLVKLVTLPKIGKEKDKGELPFHKWKVESRAYIKAARAGRVIELDPPGVNESPEWHDWFDHANSVVFAAILATVRGINVLSDVVMRLEGSVGSAKKAWQAVEAHYVRLADTNLTYLTGKVKYLAPKEGETMESFLNRCQSLREEFEAYGLQLQDDQLITQVFMSLSYQWKQSCGLNRIPASQLSWDYVAEMLQQEDNSRRQSNTNAEDALLPLGWTKKGKGGARVAEVLEEKPLPKSAPAANAAQGGGWKGKGEATPKGPRNGPKIVCYCCFESGHGCGACPKKPEGWTLTPEAKAKADEIMRKRLEQSQNGRAAANAAKAGSREASKPKGTKKGVENPSF